MGKKRFHQEIEKNEKGTNGNTCKDSATTGRE